MRYKKIIIFGPTASGKTTLAEKIEKILKTKIYHTDDFAYKKKWTVKSTKEEFTTKLKKVIMKDKWIIEGVHSEWLASAIKESDLVIFVNPSKIIMTARALKRSKERKKDTFKQKLKLLYWIYRWGPKWYRKYKKDCKEFIELKNNKQIDKLVGSLK